MVYIPDFVKPSWLNDQNAETIHKRMMETLPPDIDDTDGGFPHDFTKPTALEKAEMLEFHLVETLKIMHPMWAYSYWLDYHAQGVGLTRKPANPAYVKLLITGLPGTEIPEGFRFAVPAVGNRPAIEFRTEKDAVIEEDGTATIGVVATEPGPGGNVAPDTIVIMADKPITGIISVKNPERTTGGIAGEDDDSLRERIMEMIGSEEDSFVGCDADYIRWAKAVLGVGNVFVIPQWDPDIPNSVKVVVLDGNGEPANDMIIKAVYDYIISPESRIERKAPIGAIVTVVAPRPHYINFAFIAQLVPDYEPSEIFKEFSNNIQKYYVTAKEEDVVRYNQVHAILTNTPGVIDFVNLTMNGKSENIPLEADEYPVTHDIDPGIIVTEAEAKEE